MEINYEKLVGEEFADLCRIYDGIDRLGLQRAIRFAEENKAILEAGGISTQDIHMVKLEIADYFAKEFVVKSNLFNGELLSIPSSNDLGVGFDVRLYSYYRNKIGREITQRMKEKILRLHQDPRFNIYKKINDQN